jgi:hypothetical protein
VRHTPTLWPVACFKNKAATTYNKLLNNGKRRCIRSVILHHSALLPPPVT